jgi:hypothetical protein
MLGDNFVPARRPTARRGRKAVDKMNYPPTVESSCLGKEQLSGEDAQKALANMKRRSKPAIAYRCDFCDFWHLADKSPIGGRRSG